MGKREMFWFFDNLGLMLYYTMLPFCPRSLEPQEVQEIILIVFYFRSALKNGKLIHDFCILTILKHAFVAFVDELYPALISIRNLAYEASRSIGEERYTYMRRVFTAL